MELLIGTCVFALTLLAGYAGRNFIKGIYNPDHARARKRLRFLSMTGRGNEAIDIVKKKIMSEIPWLNRKLLETRFMTRLERLRTEAGAPRPLGAYAMYSAALFLGTLFVALFLRINLLVPAVVALASATVPFLFLVHRKKRRLEKFERQLPEALELVARALKAGHAFSGGLRLVAEEFGDPVGTEFKETLEEINFGIGVPDALNNLTRRVDNEDLKFFVVSVIVQRETGGNLAEILENLGRLIRERFKFQSRVRVLSAEGRMSAKVLLAMPFVVVGVFSVSNPEYVQVLVHDPLGKMIIIAALALMAVGRMLVYKVVSIKA
jgi:tight adherence protein B